MTQVGKPCMYILFRISRVIFYELNKIAATLTWLWSVYYIRINYVQWWIHKFFLVNSPFISCQIMFLNAYKDLFWADILFIHDFPYQRNHPVYLSSHSDWKNSLKNWCNKYIGWVIWDGKLCMYFLYLYKYWRY